MNTPWDRLADKIRESKNPGYIKLAEGIDPKQRDAIYAARLHGVGIMNDYLRHYPNGPAASHVVGFVNSEGLGLGRH